MVLWQNTCYYILLNLSLTLSTWEQLSSYFFFFEYNRIFRHTHTHSHLRAQSAPQHTVELWHWPIYKTSLQLQLDYSWRGGEAAKHISPFEAKSHEKKMVEIRNREPGWAWTLPEKARMHQKVDWWGCFELDRNTLSRLNNNAGSK